MATLIGQQYGIDVEQNGTVIEQGLFVAQASVGSTPVQVSVTIAGVELALGDAVTLAVFQVFAGTADATGSAFQNTLSIALLH